MKYWIKKQFRKKTRVYILPTKMGGYLNGLIFLMFLLGIGYSNNLLLIFTIFLFGFNLLWPVKTHFYLRQLKPGLISISSGHAKSSIHVTLSLISSPPPPWEWSIQLESEKDFFLLKEMSAHSDRLELAFSPSRRGQYFWKYLKVKTQLPFGFYQSWIYYPINQESYVYPSLLPLAEINGVRISSQGDFALDKKGVEDFRGLGRYQQDEARKISWKHYARSGNLLAKEGEETGKSVVSILYNPPINNTEKEEYLSLLATQMTECYRRGVEFSFESGTFSSPASSELNHLKDCLQVLTLC